MTQALMEKAVTVDCRLPFAV